MSDNTPEADKPTEAEADDKPAFKADPVLQAESASAPAAADVAPTEPAPAPPAHVGLSVDERAYQQFQALSQAVLESAEVASQSAEHAVSMSGRLQQATHEFRDLTEAGHKKARLLLAIGGGVLILSTLFFLIMGVRLVSRINQLDAMIEAVGKRVVELSSGMESLEGVNRSVQDLAAKQAELTKSQSQIEGRIDASLKESESLVAKVPTETAKQVAASSDSIMKQVQGMNGRLQAQANAVQSLGNEVKSLKSAVGNVDGLKRDVEALVVLQKERYLEQLQKNNSTAARERALQYPRVAPAKPGEATGTAAAGTTPSPAGPVVVAPVNKP